MIDEEGHSITFVIFLPEMQNHILIMRKHQTQIDRHPTKLLTSSLQKCQNQKTTKTVKVTNEKED